MIQSNDPIAAALTLAGEIDAEAARIEGATYKLHAALTRHRAAAEALAAQLLEAARLAEAKTASAQKQQEQETRRDAVVSKNKANLDAATPAPTPVTAVPSVFPAPAALLRVPAGTPVAQVAAEIIGEAPKEAIPAAPPTRNGHNSRRRQSAAT